MLSEPGGPGIRVDSGVSEGFEIPLFYDPMIAKLITWGRTRDQAIRRMRRALRDYRLLGIHHNIPFLLAIIQHPLTRVTLFLLSSLALFHWAHRFRFTLFDGLQIKHLNELINTCSYGTAIAGSVTAGYFLWQLP